SASSSSCRFRAPARSIAPRCAAHLLTCVPASIRDQQRGILMAESFPLDHFMLATPDLAATAAEVERRAGVRPTPGGPHPGQGTRNMLLSLGAGCYLELIGPDANQDQTGNFAERLARLPSPEMLMFGLRTTEIDAANARATALGLWAMCPNGKRVDGPIVMSRVLPAGGLLTWRLLLLGSDTYPFGLPFFIQWETTRHPSDDSAGGYTVKKFW